MLFHFGTVISPFQTLINLKNKLMWIDQNQKVAKREGEKWTKLIWFFTIFDKMNSSQAIKQMSKVTQYNNPQAAIIYPQNWSISLMIQSCGEKMICEKRSTGEDFNCYQIGVKLGCIRYIQTWDIILWPFPDVLPRGRLNMMQNFEGGLGW